MKRKPVLLKKEVEKEVKKENVKDENIDDKTVIQSFRKLIVGVYDNAEFASEFALFIAENTTLKILLIDADTLHPIIAETLAMKHTFNANISTSIRTTSSFNMAMDYMAKGKPTREIFQEMCIKCKSLYVLTGNDDLNMYEYYPENAFKELLIMAIKCFDMVIVNTNACIYDAFYVDTLDTCDTMLYPVELTADKLKKVNQYVMYGLQKRSIEKDRQKIIGFNYSPLHMPKSEVKAATEKNFLGTIVYDEKRISARSKFHKRYKMSRKVKNDYITLLKKFNIHLGKRGFFKKR
ncbi:hypothetical protein HZI73_26200 (plasmid) [Vallitalea pronyensis]|uniref:Uncharacterized protein n=1 Tax=Vallitalea pronyensis TaxID=1348613 RepID=A0A8J8MQB8_9FIRM|nr:hypothetical protein [Vallitalea pronyensis]QUI25907.1 hypothetical protein HZI73_26200 [Vallitalea pronyensis]